MSEYKCDHCGGTFSGRPEEEAAAEAVERYGVDPRETPREEWAILCDDCDKKFMRFAAMRWGMEEMKRGLKPKRKRKPLADWFRKFLGG